MFKNKFDLILYISKELIGMGILHLKILHG